VRPFSRAPVPIGPPFLCPGETFTRKSLPAQLAGEEKSPGREYWQSRLSLPVRRKGDASTPPKKSTTVELTGDLQPD
jgi:hypothetical protein